MEFFQTVGKGTNKVYFPILIGIYAFLLYANTLSHGFVLDDIAVIEQNKFVQSGFSGIDEILTTFYWRGYWDDNAGLYRPLSLITFAIEYQLSPDNPSIHHFFSVLYYSICCVLLFQVFRAFFEKINPLILFLLVGIFVSHPIHTEVVANIKSRDEILSLLFVLLTIKGYYFMSLSKFAKIFLTGLTFFLALLSKEGTVVFLPIFLLYEWTKHKKLIPVIKNTWYFLLIVGVWLGIHTLVITNNGTVDAYDFNDNSLVLGSFWEQKATAISLLIDYVGQLFVPISFSYDYSFQQIKILSPSSWKFILAFILGVTLLFIGIKNLFKGKIYVAGIFIFFFSLALTSNVFFIIGTTYAERFLFITVVAELLLLLSFLVWLYGKKVQPKVFIGSLVVLNVIYAFQTMNRNKDWKSNFTLFEAAVSVSPKSARVHYNYGTALLVQKESTKSDIQRAITHFEQCLELDSSYSNARINLANAYIKVENYEMAKYYLLQVLEFQNNDPILLGSLGEVEFRLNEFDPALIHLQRAQELGNQVNLINNYLGTIYFNKNEIKKAISYFQRGLKNDATNLNLLLNMANALAANKQFPEALYYFKLYKLQNPNNIQVNSIIQNFEKEGVIPIKT